MLRFSISTFVPVLLLAGFIASAQKNADVILLKTTYKAESQYAGCRAVETPAIAFYGMTFPGGLRQPRHYFPSPSLTESIVSAFGAMKGNVHSNDTLLIQVRQFLFTEEKKDGVATAKFSFKAYAYGKSGIVYHLLRKIDTLAVTVTDKPFEVNVLAASRILNDFLAKAMTMPAASSPVMALEDINFIDSYEKRQLPLYTVTRFVDGMYPFFDRFRAMEPSTTDFTIERNKNGKLKQLSYKNFQGVYVPVDPDAIYAVVENGVAYAVHERKLEPLYRKEDDDDLYFEGDISIGADPQASVMMGSMFGLLGGAMYGAMAGKTVRYEIRIRQIDGERIPEREIRKKK